jgi:hypothetical protein
VSDIVERLRRYTPQTTPDWQDFQEAAAEIERLREALRETVRRLDRASGWRHNTEYWGEASGFPDDEETSLWDYVLAPSRTALEAAKKEKRG